MDAIEIWTGDLVEHESERSTLREIVDLLAGNRRQAIVFANFEVSGRQIDLFVGLDDTAIVLEAKHSIRPIGGGENGDWQVRLASGNVKRFRNPYRQVLAATLAVKNAANDFAYNGSLYIGAVLVYTPRIPPGSQAFQGNRKVSVIGLDELRTVFDRTTAGSWSVDFWRKFAVHLNLTRMPSIDAVCDPALADAEKRLRKYTANYVRTYGNGEALVPFACRSDCESISSAEVTRQVAEGCGNLWLKGSSGCGKSMLADASGTAFGNRGGVPIAVQGKDFTGSIKKLLDLEARLLGARSASQLLGDARRMSRPILFVFDGYNECAVDLQRRFTRGIAALSDRYEGGYLVTSQVAPIRGDLLKLRELVVTPPTMETKLAIAEAASQRAMRQGNMEPLLSAVSTGLEARLVGEVEANVAPGGSRFALFDAFARRRLDEAASAGIRVLAQVAAWLFERFAFSLSIREFDRLMDSNRVSTELRRLLIDKRLLALRGDRVSFPHEMFLDAFAAEAVVRQASGCADSVLKALSNPVHAARKELIIGAIDDDSVLGRLLPRLEDYASINACFLGRCGSHAKLWGQEHCRGVWARLREEAAGVRFRMRGEGNEYVDFDGSSFLQWSRGDRAFLGLLTEQLVDGRFLEDALETVGMLDERIARESVRLQKETGTGRTELRNYMFAASYVHSQGSSRAPGISLISADLHSGLFMALSGRFKQPGGSGAAQIRRKLAQQDLTSGQLLSLLTLCRWNNVEIPASFMVHTIAAQWESAPYHLRLALLDFCALRCDVESDTERTKLISTIEGLFADGDSRIPLIAADALKFLGAFDDAAHRYRAAVRENIRHCLARPTDSSCQAEAWSIFSSQFDHPYEGAFSEAINGLSDNERKMLFEMALQGTKGSDFWLAPLILELASFADRDVGESIGRWTTPPAMDNRTMPQADIQAFVVAHMALARLGCPIPDRKTASDIPSVKALSACGAILYWCNRDDLDEDERLSACKSALSILDRHGKDATLDVLRECEGVSSEGFKLLPGNGPVVRSVVARFPAEAAAMSRVALRNPEDQVGYFRTWSRFDKKQILEFGIGILASYGNRSDGPLLRRYAESSEHGASAIAALRAIDDRL